MAESTKRYEVTIAKLCKLLDDDIWMLRSHIQSDIDQEQIVLDDEQMPVTVRIMAKAQIAVLRADRLLVEAEMIDRGLPVDDFEDD